MHALIVVGTRALQNSQIAAVFPDLFLKSLVILLVAGTVNLCWRRSAASARHLVWFLAVAGVLGLPGLSSLLPAWQRPVWTVGTRAGSDNDLTLTLAFAPAKGTKFAIPGDPASPRTETVPSPGQPGRAGGQRLTTHFQIGWAAVVITVWLAGTAAFLFSVAAGRFRLGLVRRAARPPQDPAWSGLLNQLVQEMRVGRRVTLLQSAGDVMPVTWGWWQPVILLPAGADAWSQGRRRVVLLHELAHVKRWDCLTQAIAQLACALYWFNPLVWLAARRMCIERERACDDLVLEGGCKPSDYAAHLVEIARTFRRLPQVAAIAMARSSELGGRVAAIVDAKRVRRAPPAWLLGLGVVAVAGLVAAVAAQKADDRAMTETAKRASRPWFDERLRAFFTAKAAQARQLAAGDSEAVPPEVWAYFEAGRQGDWQTATNLWRAMREQAHQYGVNNPNAKLDKVWAPILETDLAWEQFANWKEKYVLAYGKDIIKSIPAGSIYFGGTDPGRGVITAMTTSHAEGKPFFTLTQNALADGTYTDYLRTMYGATIYTPTANDAQTCFQEYLADAERRLAEGKLKPGEDVRRTDNRVQVSGQVAVMSINGLLTKVIFDHNPGREFYVEESFPLDWMYPHLTPHGLILKLNREAMAEISETTVREDHDYWARYLRPILGDWLKDDTSAADVATFVEQVYLKHDLHRFKGDRQLVEDTWAQKAFSKLRSSISGVYAWRATNAKTPQEKQRMIKAADLGFRQAFALCPSSQEALFRYVQLLLMADRLEDARLIAETSLKFDPENAQVSALVGQLKAVKAKQ